jgi:DNA polymerase-3 subunit beta
MTTTESPSKPKRSPKAKKNGAAPAPAPEETSLPDASAKVLEEQPPSPAVRQEAMPGTEPPPRHGSAEEGDVLSLTIEATALARVLGQVKGATQKKTTMPVLANVLLRTREDGRLEVAATDLELSLVTSTPAEIRRHGSLSIACRTLYEIVRGLPKEQVHLQADRKNWIEIRCGRSRYRIAGMAADGFPQIGDAGGDRRAVDAGALREMIDRTAYAICKDSQRYNLCGLFFQGLPGGKTAGGDEVNPGLRAVSTDGHRLALADARWSSAPEVPTVTIPAKGIEEIRKLLTEGDDAIVRLGISENHIVVERGDIRLVCQLVEGQFPEYQ